MEVLLDDGVFPRLIEEYMGPDARRYFDYIVYYYEARIRDLEEQLDDEGEA